MITLDSSLETSALHREPFRMATTAETHNKVYYLFTETKTWLAEERTARFGNVPAAMFCLWHVSNEEITASLWTSKGESHFSCGQKSAVFLTETDSLL